MFLFFAALIIAIACSAITIKTLVGYSDLKLFYKIPAAILIVLGWFAPLIMWLLSSTNILSGGIYMIVSHLLYSLMGFVFILFIAIMLRDVIWYIVYGIAKMTGRSGWHIHPKNLSLLGKANCLVVLFSIAISVYALYQGYKQPEVRELTFYSDKITGDMTIAQISDLHINRATPLLRIQQLVNDINMLNPDVIVLTGDTIDDNVVLIEEHLKALKELSAPFGVYSIMGNHEFYNDIYASKRVLNDHNLTFLFNGGLHINNTNVFIAGIPDLGTMYERVNLWRTLGKSKKKDYKILLSHTPNIIDSLSSGLVDLVLSGHTHGGQIFPFHLFVKQANRYLAGQFRVNGTDLFVSRGAGTWGPAMRLFAPADIALIHLKKKNKQPAS